MPPRYRWLAKLNNEKFKRMTGVRRTTFVGMVDIIAQVDRAKKAAGGRTSKLCVEDRLLMALEYLREYRTYFHLGQSYGLSKSTAYKVCRVVEDALVKDGRFSLPGKKALLESGTQYEVVLIDATETSIERPKKDSAVTTPARRSPIP